MCCISCRNNEPVQKYAMCCLCKGRKTLLVHSSSQQLIADGLEPDLVMYGCLMKFAASRDQHGSVMPSAMMVECDLRLGKCTVCCFMSVVGCHLMECALSSLLGVQL